MPIINNSLEYYFHYKDGITNGKIRNLAPNPDNDIAKEAILNGCTLTDNGIYFDGVDDYISIMNNSSMYFSFTIEIVITPLLESNKVSLFSNNDKNLIGFDNQNFIGASGGTFADTIYEPFYKVTDNQRVMYTFVLVNKPVRSYTVYEKLEGSPTYSVKTIEGSFYNFIEKNLAIGKSTPSFSFYNGYLTSFKIYYDILNEQQVVNNHKYFDEIGLTDNPSPVESPPSPTIISVSKSKISSQQDMNTSTIKFKFDKDVTDWEVRVLGAGNGTGLLADSGGSAKANQELTAIIDNTELSIEGENKVNIYGKGTDGIWTKYEP